MPAWTAANGAGLAPDQESAARFRGDDTPLGHPSTENALCTGPTVESPSTPGLSAQVSSAEHGTVQASPVVQNIVALGQSHRSTKGTVSTAAGLRNALLQALGTSIPLPAADYILATRRLDHLLRSADNQTGTTFQRILQALSVDVLCSEADRGMIPGRGATIIVANHPHGLLDGLALGALLDEVRSDTKLIANSVLMAIPELANRIIPVDTFGGKLSLIANARAIRQATDWLKAGCAVIVFPAGAVSRFQPRTWEVTDGPWGDLLVHLSKRSGARVIPAYLDGRNSILFQLASLVSPTLATALLSREALSTRKRISIRVGRPIAAKTLAQFPRKLSATAYVRLRTYLLGTTDRPNEIARHQGVIVNAADPTLLEKEIASLPATAKLLSHGSYEVFVAPPLEIPAVLAEIGRLREVSFRAAGEGTGRSSDLDGYDQHYLHLFLWKSDTKEVVGAYRLGSTDSILGTHGPSGMYSTTLFEFAPDWWRLKRHALELGRSFIRPEYQRSYHPLRLLWKGIGAFLERYPHRFLFGPVSISSRYSSLSRELIASFLSEQANPNDTVRPRRPFKRRSFGQLGHVEVDLNSLQLDDLDDMVSDIQRHKWGLPVLLRQYLGLGGAVLEFNLDPHFSDALDGLLLVDILDGDTRRLRGYLGDAALQEVERAHRSGTWAA